MAVNYYRRAMAKRAKTGIGARIFEGRTEKGLTQPQLAKLTGMSQRTISKLERGDQKTTTFVVELAAALGYNPRYMRTGKLPKAAGPASLDAERLLAAFSRLNPDQQRTLRAYLDIQMPGWDDDGPGTDINIPKGGK